MAESKTKDIAVKVETNFQEQDSQPEQDNYVFAYRVTIENQGDHTIKLLRRYWHITDSNSEKHEVEGEGVVGKQPVLEPGQSHQYVSGCNFQTDIAKMEGFFTMEKIANGEQFEVEIPEFYMITPYRLN